MARVRWGDWAKFSFWYGASVGIIIAFLSLIFGAFTILISPSLGFLGFLGFFGFILLAILSGFTSIIRFLIGRLIYSKMKPTRSKYWRIVTVAVLGDAPFWVIGTIAALFTAPAISTMVLLPITGIAVSILITMLWSSVFIWIWKSRLNRGIPI